jgi:hypothetical protein
MIDSIIDLIPYIISYSILISLLFLENKNVKNIYKKSAMLLCVAMFTLFRGLRWETGTDWYQFYMTFKQVDEVFGVIRYQTTILEPGYAFLNLFIREYISDSYTAFLLIFNAILLLIYYDCSWKYFPKNPIYAFVFTLLIVDMIFPVRLTFASGIIFYAYRYAISRNFLKFVICVLLAGSIHNSALLVMPFYFLLNIKIPSKILITTFFVCIFLSYSSILDIIVENSILFFMQLLGFESSLLIKAHGYIKFQSVEWESTPKTIIFMLLRSLFFIILFVVWRKEFDNDVKYNLFLNCFFISLFIGIVFKYQMTDMIRFQGNFTFGTAMLSSMILGNIKGRNNRMLLCSVIVVYAMYKICEGLIIGPWSKAFFPYKTIFGDF